MTVGRINCPVEWPEGLSAPSSCEAAGQRGVHSRKYNEEAAWPQCSGYLGFKRLRFKRGFSPPLQAADP